MYNLGVMEQQNILRVVGEVLCEYFKDKLPEDDVFVELSEELYNHLVKMYNDTDWDSIPEDNGIVIPDNEEGELDNPNFRGHIGEYIYMAQYGEAFDAFSMDTFEEGIVIRTADNLLTVVGTDLGFHFNGGYEPTSIMAYDLPLAVALSLKNKFTTKQIIRKLSD